MTQPSGNRAGLATRVFLIAAAAVAIASLVVAFGQMAEKRKLQVQTISVAARPQVEDPIAAEANVFRTSEATLAIDPKSPRNRSAHPRTLVTYRALRAYPGAPPRIPHGLTPEEFRSGGCNTCHERGGFSQRFGAYVPITPHPEMGACLQCHVGDGDLMAIALPSMDPSARCRQCHAQGGARRVAATVDWTPLEWPRLTRKKLGSGPQPIPHTLEFRTNCLSCHVAPSAVAEIRTTHPDRANCRQCHLTGDTEAGEFVRPTPANENARKGSS